MLTVDHLGERMDHLGERMDHLGESTGKFLETCITVA